MPITIEMPKLSDTMTEGTLVRWVKKVGESVAAGDILAEVETDKATMEMEAFDEGILGEIFVQEGQKVEVGQRLALLLGPGEKAGDAGTPKPPAEKPKGAEAAGSKASKPETAKPEMPATNESTQQDRIEEKQSESKSRNEDQVSASANAASAEETRLKASPLAKKLAAELRVDLTSLAGTGPGGRIVQADVRQASQRPAAPVAQAEETKPAPAAAPAGKEPAPAAKPQAAGAEDKRIPLTGMRRAIASRLLEAKTTIPHFYLQAEVDAEPLVKFRQELNAILEPAGQPKLTVNDFILKAAAAAATRVPQANASFDGDAIVQYANVQLACAVAVEDGLVTPVIKQAQLKSLGQISAEVKDLASRARSKKLKPEEYQGGTITVSNLGGYGVEQFFAIINPPQSLIVAVGAIVKKPVVAADGSLRAGQRVMLSISCDHRVVDGAIGAQFLGELKKLVENPLLLMV
ncbi:MAG TPA: pyruvate dehydrogenase complex dihydrolipoamide acetyltransferase [Chthoniobacterales bacterium]